MLIFDCDIVSTFAKVDKIELLEKAFPHSKLYITNSVYTELMRARRMGFSFPDRVFRKISITTLEEKEIKDFQKFSLDTRIHFGEAEGLSIAKNRKAFFLTNDSIVVNFCRDEGIKVLNLKDVLVLIARKGIVTKEEMVRILKDIEDRDNTFIKNKEDILEEYKIEG